MAWPSHTYSSFETPIDLKLKETVVRAMSCEREEIIEAHPSLNRSSVEGEAETERCRMSLSNIPII